MLSYRVPENPSRTCTGAVKKRMPRNRNMPLPRGDWNYPPVFTALIIIVPLPWEATNPRSPEREMASHPSTEPRSGERGHNTSQ
jgi:hypothetical protein